MLTISEAARATGKARQTIYKHIKDGKLSVKKDGLGHTRIDPAELQRAYGTLKTDSPETPVDVAPTPKADTAPQADFVAKYEHLLDTQNNIIERQAEQISTLLQELSGFRNLLEHKTEAPKKKGLIGRIAEAVTA